jgi:cell wall assembly regulator SMI1
MNDDVFQTMQSIWKRIETHLRIEAEFEKMPAEAALRNFQPGATEEELQAAETALGVVFPEDVKASYHIHNGKMFLGDPDQRLRRLCSLQEIVHTWERMKKYAHGENVKRADDWLTWDGQPIRVRVETWNVNWIPLLEGSDGDVFCLDLAPTPHGQMGQIIDSDAENGTSHRWLAPNWQAFLSTFADDLEAGEYCYEEGALTWS